MFKYLLLIALIFLASCASNRPHDLSHLSDKSILKECLSALQNIEKTLVDNNVTDAEGHRIDGYPYLRTNRFLSSLPVDINNNYEAREWLLLLHEYDSKSRKVEIANLKGKVKRRLDEELDNNYIHLSGLRSAMSDCHEHLILNDINSPAKLKDIKNKSNVPDNYSLSKRAIGLYPVTRYPVLYSFKHWKSNNLEKFTSFDAKSEWEGQPVVYEPQAKTSYIQPDEISEIIKKSLSDTFDIPHIPHDSFIRIAQSLAPVFSIEQISDADKIGKPEWSENDELIINTNHPVVFARLEFTWFDGKILPQIVYTAWFPERPKDNFPDLLGGKIDGIIWRLTLDRNGKTLIADTIHPCGCYHFFFPSKYIKKTPGNQDFAVVEEIETPQQLPDFSSENRLVINIAANTHYIQNISLQNKIEYTDSYHNHDYTLIIGDKAPDFDLRSMPLSSGNRKSLYGTDGIIQGTQRLERFLLWPMGIQNAGAMRQWGRHATAFVGRRHFDDPFLFQDAFEYK